MIDEIGIELDEITGIRLFDIADSGLPCEPYRPGKEDSFALRTLPICMWSSGYSLKDRENLPAIPAIYFAISRRTGLLYIGRAKNLCHRWLSHHRLSQLERYGDVKIAWVSFHNLREEHLPTLESAYIRRFLPPLNQTPMDQDFIDTSEAWGDVEVNHKTIIFTIEMPANTEFAKYLKKAEMETGISPNDQILLYASEHVKMIRGKGR